ncbi:MAG: hypothetical protein HYY06_17900 [Deltaproteobacteria bacterium]|nr:hypothetical protein [Deltaproteobacteria bacterium]
MSWRSATAASVLLLLLPGLGQAQRASEPIAPTRIQTELYRRAFDAFGARDYSRAIDLLRSALALGDRNIFHLSLGRALFHAGRCAGADEELDRALSAPAVAEPPAEEVARRVAAYRQDLRARCPGSVVVSCEPASIRARIDDGPPVTCGEPVSLPPGEHVIHGELDGRTLSQRVAVEPLARSTLVLRIEAAPRQIATRRVPPPTMPALRRWGWILAVNGAAVLAATVLVDVAVLGSEIDGFERAVRDGDPVAGDLKERVDVIQAVVIGAYAVGGLLVATGGLFLVLDSGARPARAQDVEAWWAPDGAGLRLRF